MACGRKGASNATRKLVHDSDANATMKLWDVYEVTGNGKGKFLGKGATATVRLIQHKKTKKNRKKLQKVSRKHRGSAS